MDLKNKYDLIVIGAGAAGMIAAIKASKDKKKVLLLEKLPRIGAKLKATGGGRCNLTNTLSNEEFMSKFGRDGRFMQDALCLFDNKRLTDFFKGIGVDTHAPDGFRVFPISHDSSTVISALQNEMNRLGVDIVVSQKAKEILFEKEHVKGVRTALDTFYANSVILATGGLGYPGLGAEGDGYKIAKELGHKVTELYPAMTPLKTKESWVASCRADTIPKVELKVNIKKHNKLKANGDLIFTKNGIRGPVVLDAATFITPLLDRYGEVPLLVNLTKGMDEEQILKHLKNEISKDPGLNMLELLKTLIPESIAKEFCILTDTDPLLSYSKISGTSKDRLIKILAWTPLHVSGHEGFKTAMITKGGIDLKEIDPKSMQSKLIKGLYFCGEIMNLDGPCGGYNLQWSFASGYLAGSLKDR